MTWTDILPPSLTNKVLELVSKLVVHSSIHFRLNSQCSRRLTWSPKRVDSTNLKRLPANAHAHRDVFHARLPWQGMVKLYKGSISYHHGDTICHPKSSYVTTKLHGTSTRRCNNNAIFSDRVIFTFPTVAVCRPR